MMGIREATALMLLFDACTDQKLRERVLKLVPELTELSEANPL